MAHKKGVGSSRNGRDSNAKRLGIKRAINISWWHYTPSTGHENTSRLEC